MFRHSSDCSLFCPRQTWKGASLLLLGVLALCAEQQLLGAEGDGPQTPGKCFTVTAGEGRSGKLDSVQAWPSRDYPIVSLVRLIANPERYHNQRVRVLGYLVVEFEGTGIYLSKQDADHGIMVNAFMVAFDRTKIPFDGPHGPVRFANQYVCLEGTFDMENPAPWQGTIANVDSVHILSDCGERRERRAREILKSAEPPSVHQGDEKTEKRKTSP